jgi:Retroviral aspartyl protease
MDSQAEVGGIDQHPEEWLTKDGLSKKLLMYYGKIGGHRAKILVDGGSMGNFISSQIVNKLSLLTHHVSGFSILFPNGESSPCNKEVINTYLQIQDHEEVINLKVAPLPHHDIILGKPWLEKWNPDINWRTNEIQIRTDNQEIKIATVTDAVLKIKKLHQDATIPE